MKVTTSAAAVWRRAVTTRRWHHRSPRFAECALGPMTMGVERRAERGDVPHELAWTGGIAEIP